MSLFANHTHDHLELLQAYEALDEKKLRAIFERGGRLSRNDFYTGTIKFLNEGMTTQFSRIAMPNASAWGDDLHYPSSSQNISWWLAANARGKHHWETPHWRATFDFLKATGRLDDAICPAKTADIGAAFGPGRGWRLLHAAIAANNDNLAIWLISNGASPDGHAVPNAKRSDGTRENEISGSNRLLREARTPSMDQTPLQMAASRSRRAVIAALLAAGADPAKRGFAEPLGYAAILASGVFSNPSRATLAQAIDAIGNSEGLSLATPDAGLSPATLAMALASCNRQERLMPWSMKLVRSRSWSALRSAAQAFDWPACELHCAKLGSATLHGLSPAAFAMAACAEGFDEAGSGLSSMGWRERCQALGEALSAQSSSRHCPAWRASCSHAAAALLGPSTRAPWLRLWKAAPQGVDTPLEWAMRSEAIPSLQEIDALGVSPKLAPNALAAAISCGFDQLAAGLCSRGWRLDASFYRGESGRAVALREIEAQKSRPDSPRAALLQAILAEDERSEISSSCPESVVARASKPCSL